MNLIDQWWIDYKDNDQCLQSTGQTYPDTLAGCLELVHILHNAAQDESETPWTQTQFYIQNAHNIDVAVIVNPQIQIDLDSIDDAFADVCERDKYLIYYEDLIPTS